ncbi:facilitated trehalose transporter Tret1-like [Battus philenor]|uniref:facilitated trehalose transporter Tret1-like n=1 Tax=Battus philenor TaxID=42288 RepID=UPI0035CE9520
MLKSINSPIIRQYAVVLIVNICVFTTGMNLAWPSPMLVKLTNETQTILPRTITEEEGSWIVSVEFLFAFIFNYLMAILLDSLGRKYCVLLGCVPKTIGVFLYIFATDVWMLILGRLLFGLADSFVFIGVSIYASEVATKNTRGASCSLTQMFSSLGIVMTLSAGPFLSYLTFNIVFAVIIIATSIPVLFLPETPYYLYNKGRENEAIKVLEFLHGSEILAKQEIEEYTMSKKSEIINKMAILKNPVVRKIFPISITFVIGAQLVGYNAVSYYLQTILISTGTTIMPEIASVIIGIIQFVSSFLTPFTTDRYGRKVIFLTTLIGMMLGMVGLGTFFQLKPSDGVLVPGFLNYLPLISLILVVYCYNAGVGSLLLVVTAELFDGPARAFGVSITLAVNTTMIFLTTKYFPMLLSKVGPAITYWSFGGVCILMCLFIMFCLPETKGKSFVEIQGVFSKKKNEDKHFSTAL